MEIQYKVIGVLLIGLALIHIIFPKYFNWKEELKSLSLVNQEIMKVHTFFIALTVFLMGVLCLTSANDLIHTALGRRVSLGFGIFWSFRLFMQFYGFSAKLWKGKTKETIFHVAASVFWFYLSFVFFYSMI